MTSTPRLWFCRAAALGAASLAGAAFAAPQNFALDAANTHVYWEVQHFGTSTSRGRFETLEGSITLDREAKTGNVSISIDTASVSTGIAPFNGVLRGPQMLASEAHPKAYFVAQRITFDKDRVAAVSGELTLRGESKPLTLRAKQFACRTEAETAREICGGDFEAELTRSDFGITHSLPFVSDRVRLVVQIEAVRL